MQIDTAGTYTLKYTAEDACGNVTEVTREVVAEQISYRTVLYTDGTFIINEKSTDIDANVAEHGVATNIYPPFDPNGASNREKYIFGDDGNFDGRYWATERRAIKAVEVGSRIQPFNMTRWFKDCYFLVSADLTNVDTSRVTAMLDTFADCYPLATIIGLDRFDTTNVTTFENMFYSLSEITEIDVSSFDTHNATSIRQMFAYCTALTTILASNAFVVNGNMNIGEVFNFDSVLVGGAGTVYDSSHIDGTYARIDNPPDAPGYFTLKSA